MLLKFSLLALTKLQVCIIQTGRLVWGFVLRAVTPIQRLVHLHLWETGKGQF